MKLKDMIGSMASKFAALVLTFGLAGGASASPVAQIGATGYTTLQGAIDAAAASGDTIVLLDDIVFDPIVNPSTKKAAVKFPSGKSITLDLAGHSISADLVTDVSHRGNAHVVWVAGNLTIEDSSASGTGEIANSYGESYGCTKAVYVETGASLTMNGGTVTATSATGMQVWGNLTLKSGAKVQAISTANKGNYPNGTIAIEVRSPSVVNIEGATISSAFQYVIYGVGGSVNIKSGFVSANPSYGLFGGGGISVTGGLFNLDPTSACANGYIAIPNSDASTASDYPFAIMRASAVVMKIGSAYSTYDTIAEALASAGSEYASIYLYDDVEENVSVSAANNVAFYGDSHKLTGTISVAEGGSFLIESGLFTADPAEYLGFGLTQELSDGAYTVVAKSLTADAGGLYHITSLDDFVTFRRMVNAGNNFLGKTVKLDTDINLSTVVNWVPIGKSGKAFSGTFEGQNHVISNLTIDDASLDNAGIFGYVYNGAIKSLTVENASIVSDDNVGVVSGYTEGTTLSGVTVCGAVSIAAGSYAGGVVGEAYTGTLTNCCVRGAITITASTGDAGGISSWSYAKIVDCSVYGEGASAISGGQFTGGIIGYRGEGSTPVLDCVVSNLSITAYSCGVGGIVGALHYNDAIVHCTVSGVDVIGGGPIYPSTVGVVAGAVLSVNNEDHYIYGCTIVDSTATTNGVQTLALNGDKSWSSAGSGLAVVYYNSDNTSTVNDNTVQLTSGTYEVNPEAALPGMTSASVAYAAKNYVADGYVATDNGDGTWTVAIPPVAQIGDVGYKTFAAAIDAAETYAAAHNGVYPTITVLNGATEQENTRWSIVDGYLVRNYFYQDASDANLWHIENLEGLKAFRDSINKDKVSYANKTIKIDANIDLTNDGYWESIKAYPGSYLSGATIDGDGHTITGMAIVTPDPDTGYSYGGGFIDKTAGALTVTNLKFINATVTAPSGSQVGVVVGMTYGNVTLNNVDLENCTVTGVTKTGAFVGQNDGGTVALTNCDVVNTQVNANYSSALMIGLLNTNSNGSQFTNCTADGNSRFVWVADATNGFETKGDVVINGRTYSVSGNSLWLTDPGTDCWSEQRIGNATYTYDGVSYSLMGSVFYPNYVAQIGANKYETLEAAYDAATAGDTITLLADITYGADRSVPVWTKPVNINLGGHTLTTNSEVNKDASNGGYTTAAICFSIPAASAGSVTISNGKIVTAYGAGVYADDPGLTLTLSDLTIEAAKTGTQATAEYSAAVRVTSGAKVIIESGSYSGAYAVAASNSGADFEINGGTFTGDIFFSNYTTSGKTKSVTITGGTFNGGFVNPDKGTLAVSGGTFPNPVPEEYCATGYIPTAQDPNTGFYTVKQGTYVAQIGTTKYETLAEAIAAVPTDGTQTTITMIADVSDAVGISVASGKNFIVDFDGHTYTVNKPGAGSSGTETSAFQLLKDSTITFKNGTINIAAENLTPAVSPAKNIKRIIQNYANLTLDNMVINAANQYGGEAYALSFNNGSSSLINGTKVITTSSDTVAFDVYDYSSGGYASGSQLTIGEGVVINGKVVFDNSGNVAGNTALTVTGGTIGQVVAANGSATDDHQIKISGGSFGAAVPEEYCANGFIPKDNGDGTYGVKQGTYVAQIVKTGVKYETLAEAIAAVPADGTPTTIMMIADETIKGNTGVTIAAGQNVAFDLNGHSIELAVTAATATANLVTNNGALTINDSSEGGALFMNAEGMGAINNSKCVIQNNGRVTVNGGTISARSTDANGKAYGAAIAISCQRPSADVFITINGGTLVAEGGATTGNIVTSSAVYMMLNSDSIATTFTMTDGTLVASGTEWCSAMHIYLINNNSIRSSVNISGGELQGVKEALYVHGGPTLDYQNVSTTISGGTFRGYSESSQTTEFALNVRAGSLTVTGGTFNYGSYLGAHEIDISGGNFTEDVILNRTGGTADASISGGTFGGEIVVGNEVIDESQNLYAGGKFVSGGNFATQVPVDLCSDGYLCTTAPMANGYYQVVPAATVTFSKGEEADVTDFVCESMTYPSGNPAEIALPQPTYTSTVKTFAGWKVNGEGDAVSALPAGTEGDIAFTATWVGAQKVTITESAKTAEITVTDEWIQRNVTIEPGASDEAKKTAIEEVLNTTADNGLKAWENYVLGQSPTAKLSADAGQGAISAMPVTSSAQTPTVDTGFKVQYRLDKVTAAGKTETAGTAQDSDVIPLDLTEMEGSVAYYKTTAIITSTDENSDVSVEVPADNTIGVLKVASAPKTAMIAVPWAALDGDGDISAANLVRTANLTEGDELHYYKNGKFQSWTLAADGTWQSTKNVSDSGTTDGDAASGAKIPRGSAVWLKRQDASKPVYLVGEVGTGTAKTALEGGAENAPAWNMVASPSVEGLDISEKFSSPNVNDRIVVPTDGAPKNYTYKDGKWGYTSTIVYEDGIETVFKTDDTAVQPGTGFWYLNSGDAKDVDWTSGEEGGDKEEDD